MTATTLPRPEAAFSEAPAYWNTRCVTPEGLPCQHRHVVLETGGGLHFNAGEAWDDIQESRLCLDCMEEVTEAGVHSASIDRQPHGSPAMPRETTHGRA